MAALFHLTSPASESMDPVDGRSPLARWLALDLVVGVYVVATVFVVLLAADRIPASTTIAVAHIAGLAAYTFLRRMSSKSAFWRNAFFVSLFALVLSVFQAMGAILPHLHAESVATLRKDAALAEVDVRLFGGDPTEWFFPLLNPVTVTLLEICYTSYFFLPVVLTVYCVRGKRYRTFLSYAAIAIGCFFTTYVGYYLVPAYGPRFFYEYEAAIPHSTVSLAIHEAIDALDYIKLNAFPSGHCAATIVFMALIFRESRRLGWICAPFALGLIVATVALRYHYLIDVVAGAACAALWVPWGMRAVFRFDHGHAESATRPAP